MIPRLIKMFTNPAEYWNDAVAEPGDIQSLLMPQMAILAAIPAVAGFLGSAFTLLRFGFTGAFVGAMIGMILQYAFSIGAWIIMGYVIDLLAPSFNAQKDLGQSMKLAAGAIIPGWLGAGLAVIPFLGSFLGLLGALAGLGYGGYLLYLGLPVMNSAPEEKTVVYAIASIAIMIVVSAIIFSLAACPVTCMTGAALVRP